MTLKELLRALLNFINVIEPGSILRLSLTKIGMWMVIIVVPYIAVSSPGNIAAVFAALATAAPFVINYIHQRSCQTATNPPAQSVAED